jgi:cytidylate kinase
MKSKVITIVGENGSGKSSTSNGVAEALGYRRFSAGDFQRAAAASLGLTYDEYQKVALNDPKYDRMADDALIAAGKEGDVVIDSRLGYHFIPESFKVFLALDPEIAAARILKDAETNPNRHKETVHGVKDIPSIVAGIKARFESERERYLEHYGITDYYDPKHFDLIIDTSKHPLEEVIQIVVEKYNEWLAK